MVPGSLFGNLSSNLTCGKHPCGLSGPDAELSTYDDGCFASGQDMGSSLDHLRLLICIIELFLLVITLTPQGAGLV